MSSLLSILIFLIILFVYIHLTDQHKTSNDLELFEFDYISNKELNESCNIKQPLVFNYKDINEYFVSTVQLENLENQSENITLYDKNNEEIVLNFSSANLLVQSDKKHTYYSENNENFIYDSNLQNVYETNDNFLKPHFTVHTKYDIHIGTENTYTPLQYHNFYRKFFIVHSGKIRVKLIPPKYNKYLNEVKDYENYRFYSSIDIWEPSKNHVHLTEKTKSMEFDIDSGNVLYIPPYWWYSIKYLYHDDTPCLYSSITYVTPMNILSNIKHYVLYYIQQSNTKEINIRTKNIADNDITKKDIGTNNENLEEILEETNQEIEEEKEQEEQEEQELEEKVKTDI